MTNVSLILPVPDDVNPVTLPVGQDADHIKVVPEIFDVGEILNKSPEQIVCESGVFVMIGNGFTVIT